MKRIDQLKLVVNFAFTAKTKKEVKEFSYKIFTRKADDTLIAKTKKDDLVDVLMAEIKAEEKIEIERDEAEFLAEVEAWRASK